MPSISPISNLMPSIPISDPMPSIPYLRPRVSDPLYKILCLRSSISGPVSPIPFLRSRVPDPLFLILVSSLAHLMQMYVSTADISHHKKKRECCIDCFTSDWLYQELKKHNLYLLKFLPCDVLRKSNKYMNHQIHPVKR
jgi:hypothetical protein